MIWPEDTGLSKDSNSSEGPNGQNNNAPLFGDREDESRWSMKLRHIGEAKHPIRNGDWPAVIPSRFG